LMGKQVQSTNVRVILFEARRFPIVAASFRISENEDDIFHSPFA